MIPSFYRRFVLLCFVFGYQASNPILTLSFLSPLYCQNEYFNKRNSLTVGIIELVPSSIDSKNTTGPFEELTSTKLNLLLLVEVTIIKSRFGITNYVGVFLHCLDTSTTSVQSNSTPTRQSFPGSCPRVMIKRCDCGISTNELV